MNSLSLRVRLTLVILIPLLLIAALVGAWAYRDAQRNAAERFDRSLLSTALAISRDTALSGGDALSRDTRDLLRDTSGGAVFYHVYAPDGVFVTGYATPPVVPPDAKNGPGQAYYDAVYQGASIRALRLTQSTTIDGLAGEFTFTVWQDTAVRDGFVTSRTRPTFLIIASMIGALTVIVWFGVRFGLTPLLDLEDAIEQRSANDLSPIKRRIPPEVSGIVGRLNVLLEELSKTLDAKTAFISDAAHQLRNPIAGVLSLAETVHSAKTPQDMAQRSADLLEAARSASHLANDLLALERAQATQPAEMDQLFSPSQVLWDISERFSTVAADKSVRFEPDIATDKTMLLGDPVMFEQAILNLLNNALSHGGGTMNHIQLRADHDQKELTIAVTDNGDGITPGNFDRALGRFSQIGPRAGTGLGLPISKAVVEAHGGRIALSKSDHSFTAALHFPLPEPAMTREGTARKTVGSQAV